MNRRSAVTAASSVVTSHCVNYICAGRGAGVADYARAATTSYDCRECDCLSDLPPLSDAGLRLYLCRHGETDLNRSGRIQARRSDPPLNDLGRHQASRLGRALQLSTVPPSVIYHSPLQRARETATLAAASASAHGDSSVSGARIVGFAAPFPARPRVSPITRELEDLTEVDFGSVAEGREVSAWRPEMAITYAAWAVGDWDARMLDDGESGREVLRRVDASLAALLDSAAADSKTRCVAAVSHSAFLRVALAKILGVSLVEATVAIKFGNAGITVVDFDNAGGGGLVLPDRTTSRDLTVRAAPTSRTHRVLRLNETRHLQGLVAST